jgi:Tol biopolymer transport system component
MLPTTCRRFCAAMAMLAAAACADGPTETLPGRLEVSVRTSGGDPDIDGYEVVLNQQVRRLYGATIDFTQSVSAGAHTVSLRQVAENCSVSGPDTREVAVRSGGIVYVVFDVVCEVTGVDVTLRTTGVAIPAAYQLSVNGQRYVAGSNGSLRVSRLAAGTYAVALTLPVVHCEVTGGNPLTVDVALRAVTPVVFDVVCWMPERLEKIAFVSRDFGASAVRVVNLDGSGSSQIDLGHSPAWSPDGTKLVFSDAACWDYWYYGFDACTGGLIVIDPELDERMVPDGGRGAFNADWSPVTNRIAFERCCDGNPRRLFTLALGASGVQPVVVPGVTLAGSPAWSPDGQQIAFECIVPEAPMQVAVCIADKDGANLRRLTNDGAGGLRPSWSPDGTRVAFDRDGQVMLATVDGQTITRLTTGAYPSWSPDGSRLVVADIDGLFLIDADGSNRERLTTGRHYAPRWRP